MKFEAIVVPELIPQPLPRSLPRIEGIHIPWSPDHDRFGSDLKYHAQIQIAFVEIGQQLGYRTWVAQNDRGIVYNERTIGEMDSVVARLEDVKLIQAYQDAQNAARLIDVVWFKNGTLMPAVIEVEHSTRVRSGLTRMKTFQDAIPPFPTRWVIAAPDEDRELVMREAATPQFASLDTKYFPYSAVEELYNLCQRRKIRGVSQEFLDCYMEPCLPLLA